MKRSSIKIIRAMWALSLLLLFFSVVAYYADPIWLGGRAPLAIAISFAFNMVLVHFILQNPELAMKRDAEKESFHDMLEKLWNQWGQSKLILASGICKTTSGICVKLTAHKMEAAHGSVGSIEHSWRPATYYSAGEQSSGDIFL